MPKAPDFSYTPEKINRIAEAVNGELEKDIARIVAIPAAERTFENTVLAFEAAVDRFEDETEIPQFLAIVSADAHIRQAGEQLKIKTGRSMVDLLAREDVFAALTEYAAKGEKLGPDEARLLEKRLRDFRKNGLGLEARKQRKVRKILKDLVDLSVSFQKNIREVSDVLEVSEEELKGLPADYVARLKRAEGGGRLLTTDYPDYTPFMENSESGEARRRYWRMFNNRCAEKNVPLLEEALRLRRQVARLMGYDSFAEYVLKDRMALRSASVFEFLERLRNRLSRKARKELRERRGLKGSPEKLRPWETAYYSNQLRKQKYDIDHQKIREYFPLDAVLEGMFGVFGELLGLKIVRADLPTWHPEVRSFELRNLDGSVAAYFYLDLFPRFGKYKNPLCSIIRTGRELKDGSYNLPAVAIVSNFTPPSGDMPPLLKFGEVETLFHEFGHVLQLLLCRAKYSRLAPINAAWDFIEVPSTLLQQWAYQPEVLKRISGHYKDPSQKLPDREIEKLIASRHMSSGMYYLRLAALSAIDMAYHTARRKIDTTKLYARLIKKVSLVGLEDGVRPQASFGHLMPTYAAGYYSYLWSEVMAADLFGVFRKAGVTDAAAGMKYRKEILEPGAGRDEVVSLEKFLGRQPGEEAFISGILGESYGR